MDYEFDIQQIENYFESLCKAHADVQHDVAGNKSFARFESGEQLNEIRKNAGRNIVVVASIDGHRTGQRDDRMFQREIVLRFACYAGKNADAESSKKAAIQKAEEIMFDFMTRMEQQQEQDLDNDIECGIMHYLQPEGFSWEPIEDQPWLQNHYGWDLNIPFKVYMPQYNAAKWIS